MFPQSLKKNVALCIHPRSEELVRLSQVGITWKSAIECAPRSILRLTGYLEVHIDEEQLRRYIALGAGQDLQWHLNQGIYVMCGGRRGQPLFWLRGDKNMVPTCGRCFPPEGAHRSQKTKVYFCPECRTASEIV